MNSATLSQILSSVEPPTDADRYAIAERTLRDILRIYPELNGDLLLANFARQWAMLPEGYARIDLVQTTLDMLNDFSYIHNDYCRALRLAVRS